MAVELNKLQAPFRKGYGTYQGTGKLLCLDCASVSGEDFGCATGISGSRIRLVSSNTSGLSRSDKSCSFVFHKAELALTCSYCIKVPFVSLVGHLLSRLLRVILGQRQKGLAFST